MSKENDAASLYDSCRNAISKFKNETVYVLIREFDDHKVSINKSKTEMIIENASNVDFVYELIQGSLHLNERQMDLLFEIYRSDKNIVIRLSSE